MNHLQLELFKQNKVNQSGLPPIPFIEIGGMKSSNETKQSESGQHCPRISRVCPYVTPDCNNCLPFARLMQELES